jgi:ferrochelatase
MPGPDPYDALLLVSFGGPERPEDVVPFLRNVTAGRDIPDERLVEVGAHYELFGGRSPLNDQNRTLVAAIREDLVSNGIDLPVYWGNRNWDPYLADTVGKMTADGITRAACFVTSAYSSYSGCRQYRENLADAVAKVPGAPRLDRLRSYFNHPGFVEPNVDAALTALAVLPDTVRREAHLVFVTHSIPEAMNAVSGPLGDAYVHQHRSVMDEISDRVREETGHRYPSTLTYCSRSGSPSVPWLEPDVNDHLRNLAARDVPAVVLVPIGFVSDHMEVVYDLDTEAMATAREVGISCERAATAGVDPRFVAMVRDLLLERAAVERGEDPVRAAVGSVPPAWDICAAGCCANPRGPRPALCGSD